MSINSNPTFTPPPSNPDPMQPARGPGSPRAPNDPVTSTNNRDTTIYTPERQSTDARTSQISQDTLGNAPSPANTEREPFEGEELNLDDVLQGLIETGDASEEDVKALKGLVSESKPAAQEVAQPPSTPAKSDNVFSGAAKVFSAIRQFFSKSGGEYKSDFKNSVLAKLDRDIGASKNDTDSTTMLHNKNLNDARNAVAQATDDKEVVIALRQTLGKLKGDIRSNNAIAENIKPSTLERLQLSVVIGNHHLRSLGKLILDIGKAPIMGLISLPGRVTSGIDFIRTHISQIQRINSQMKESQARNNIEAEQLKIKNEIDQKFDEGRAKILKNVVEGVSIYSQKGNDRGILTPKEYRNKVDAALKRFNVDLYSPLQS